ncbi:MAG: AMP-binding protein [Bacteroidota bacterium]
MNIATLLQAQARTRPDAPALIEYRRGRRRVCTFGELDDRAAHGAARLHDAGLRQGDAVLVLQPVSVELYVALAALFRLGLVAVVLDPSAGREHVAACARRLPIRGFIGSPKAHLLRLLVGEVRRIPHRFVVGPWLPGARPWRSSSWRSASWRLAQPPRVPLASCEADTPALLTFTSGSTGRPKAAVRTHGLLQAQYQALRSTLGLRARQTDLATLPIFVLANLAAGVTSVLPAADPRCQARADLARIADQIARERPTRVVATPAFLERLLAVAPDSLRDLQQVFTGGAPVFPDALDVLQKAAPRATITAVYGSTEAEPVAEVDYDAVASEDRAHTQHGGGLLAGPPVDAVALRILPDRWGAPLLPYTSETFEDDVLPPGVAGEIVVSGPHVVPGYLGGQGDAATKFQVGGTRWHRTGDAGYLDKRGRLWLLGRCGAKARDARGVLYPLAVEAAAQTEGVARAAFLAVDRRCHLVLELAAGHTGPDLRALRQRLAWAHLDRIHVTEAMPMDARHHAKIDYPALQTWAEQQDLGRAAGPASSAASSHTPLVRMGG